MLLVACGNCGASLRVDPVKITPEKPLVRCPKCNAVNRVRLPESAVPNPAPLPAEAGWLVVHDEAAAVQTLVLRPGKNTIGRLSATGTADLMIDTPDPYMSRRHCAIEVLTGKNGAPEYLLSDLGSVNGVFLNGDPGSRLSPHDQVYLNDGDVIQMGRTQVVIKTVQRSQHASEARRQALANDYQQTIIT